MPCPLCGEIECICVQKARQVFSSYTDSRFQPDGMPAGPPAPESSFDTETYDASEERFAASVEGDVDWRERAVGSGGNSEGAMTALGDGEAEARPAGDVPPLGYADPASWRQEVTARLNHYRSRRKPREPRYPSLSMQLQFDEQQPEWNQPGGRDGIVAPPPSREAVARDSSAMPVPTPARMADPPARIIEFPRGTSVLLPSFDAIADPVVETPRILEVETGEQPPPALGGILLEASEDPGPERRPGIELPLQPASMSRRIAAGIADALLVGAGVGLFAYIVFSLTSAAPTLLQGVLAGVALLGIFWAGYQYLLIVHCGATPGLRLARLQIAQFDGSPVPRRQRQWRTLAALLSEAALGLGYAWCFLDEDRLCWHDRITHTYIAPAGLRES